MRANGSAALRLIVAPHAGQVCLDKSGSLDGIGCDINIRGVPRKDDVALICV
jgi:hypothetical protein